MKIGRNDSCPCGSGKKYKKCCLPADTAAAAAAARQQAVVPFAPTEEAPVDRRRAAERLRALAAAAPPSMAGAFRRVLAKAQPLFEVAEREAQVHAATAALAAHRAEFEALLADPDGYLDRVQQVFAEESFRTAWFTKDEVRRALEQVGYLPVSADNKRCLELLGDAILHLADPERRQRLTAILLASLPGYVAAGRMLDGWVVLDCAALTLQQPEQPNPFLFEMFIRGHEAWLAEKMGAEDAFLQECGIDRERLTQMTLEELDAWVAQQTSPEKSARMTALFQSHPEQKAIATASIETMGKEAVTIVERADAARLLLSADELVPWSGRFYERLQVAAQAIPASGTPDAATFKTTQDDFVALLREMAGSIFTEARIQKLIAELRAYRNARFAADDKQTAGLAQSAILLVDRERDPGSNHFLVHLAYHSLLTVGISAHAATIQDSAAAGGDSVPN